MSWLTTITSIFTTGNDRLGDSIVKANEVAKANLTPAQKAALKAKAKAAMAGVRTILVDLLDSIPGVPKSFAEIAVNLLVNALDGAIATYLQTAKAK